MSWLVVLAEGGCLTSGYAEQAMLSRIKKKGDIVLIISDETCGFAKSSYSFMICCEWKVSFE